MQLSITDDGYIKCVADDDDSVIAEQITHINASNMSLPCMLDRYEKNVLFYHMGDNISVYDYITSGIMSFDEIKELAHNLAYLFIKLEEAGLPNQKIVADIRYLFISPSTKQLKIIQCPLNRYEESDNYKKLMESICNTVESQNAYIAIGYILEEIHKRTFDIKVFARKIQSLENNADSNNSAAEKIKNTETKVIEKKVFVNRTRYFTCAFIAALLEVLGQIAVPSVWKALQLPETFWVNIGACIGTVLVTFILFTVLKLCSKGNEEAAVITSNNYSQAIGGGELPPTPQPAAEAGKPANIKRNVEPLKDMDFEATGLLNEEVEINPLKRQEQYNKKMAIQACLVEEETGKKYVINKSVFTVGRSNECDLVIDNSIVSKKHAEIIFENDMFYVKDLRSSNNTYLNKATIEPMELYKIEDNARIGFGNKWFIFKKSL